MSHQVESKSQARAEQTARNRTKADANDPFWPPRRFGLCHELPVKQALQVPWVLLVQFELIQGMCVFSMSYLSGQWLLINLAQDGTT